MNERIKELALRAGEYVTSVYTPPVRSKVPGKIWEDGHVSWNEQFHEKFAELIVKECVRQIGDLMDFTDYPDDTEKSMVELKTLRDARQVIKEHFGIEE